MDAAETEAFAREFYSRQVTMKEIGEKGQKRLRQAKVAVSAQEA